MASIWILTIGSSDVQLDSDRTNKEKDRTEKQRSDKVWSYWYTDDLKEQCHDISFEPKSLFKDKEEPYRIAPRILGKIYQASSEQVQQEIWRYLTFPLLDNFVEVLKQYPLPKAIAVLLTDQSAIFQDAQQRRKPNSPYWQDTCTLQPILEQYLKAQFSDVTILPLYLQPISANEGLDNWNSVLEVVQSKFSELELPVDENEDQTIYVSHQAGTPAISSAVQFASLAKFGDRIKFLVSNEQSTRPSKILESSSYLKGIRRKEAETLLNSHDYSGVQALIKSYLRDDDTQILLDAAIQWNFAKFDEFAKELQKLSNTELAETAKERSRHWWWAAYESAYLAVIRFEQKDTVDALFHSFRAIEGIFSEWGVKEFQHHVLIKNDRPYLQTTILEDDKLYFERAKYKQKDGKQVPDNDIAKLKAHLEELNKKVKDKETILYGRSLYPLFREMRRDWKAECNALNRFWDNNNGISESRNRIFHQLQGLTEQELFDIWEVKSEEGWKERIRVFANYVSGEMFEFLDKEDLKGSVPSLMIKVHEKLESAIAQL